MEEKSRLEYGIGPRTQASDH